MKEIVRVQDLLVKALEGKREKMEGEIRAIGKDLIGINEAICGIRESKKGVIGKREILLGSVVREEWEEVKRKMLALEIRSDVLDEIEDAVNNSKVLKEKLEESKKNKKEKEREKDSEENRLKMIKEELAGIIEYEMGSDELIKDYLKTIQQLKLKNFEILNELREKKRQKISNEEKVKVSCLVNLFEIEENQCFGYEILDNYLQVFKSGKKTRFSFSEIFRTKAMLENEFRNIVDSLFIGNQVMLFSIRQFFQNQSEILEKMISLDKEMILHGLQLLFDTIEKWRELSMGFQVLFQLTEIRNNQKINLLQCLDSENSANDLEIASYGEALKSLESSAFLNEKSSHYIFSINLKSQIGTEVIKSTFSIVELAEHKFSDKGSQDFPNQTNEDLDMLSNLVKSSSSLSVISPCALIEALKPLAGPETKIKFHINTQTIKSAAKETLRLLSYSQNLKPCILE